MVPADPVTPEPETVTEAVSLLEGLGYTDDIAVGPSGASCASCAAVHPLDGVVLDYTFRFEGPSDPGDEAIVLGVRCPTSGAKGLIVSAFGPDTDPAHAAVLVALAKRPRS